MRDTAVGVSPAQVRPDSRILVYVAGWVIFVLLSVVSVVGFTELFTSGFFGLLRDLPAVEAGLAFGVDTKLPALSEPLSRSSERSLIAACAGELESRAQGEVDFALYDLAFLDATSDPKALFEALTREERFELARPPEPPERLDILPGDIEVRITRPKKVRAIYATGYVAGNAERFERLLDLIDATDLNAIVIDVKDDTGTLSYRSRVPLANEIGASMDKVKDMRALLLSVEARGIFPIARIVVFKDPLLSSKRPETAIKDVDGRPWRDKHGRTWIDPRVKEVWDYNIDIAKEAIALGFREIQFDYIRFPDDKYAAKLLGGAAGAEARVKAVSDFLAYASKELKKYGVTVTGDIFGLVCSATTDMGIGPKLEEMAAHLDYVAPMVYPSHYWKGSYGIPNPNAAPYETVHASLRHALERLEKAGLKTKIIPWLQDFSLGYPYGEAEVRAQIKAARDLGIEEYMMWNPANQYTGAAYKRRAE